MFLSDRQEHAGPWPFARVFVAANLSVNCRHLAVNSSRIWTTGCLGRSTEEAANLYSLRLSGVPAHGLEP